MRDLSSPPPGFSRWPAPAKLNLFLHILGTRADGFHELQTAFQFIDLCDEIDIRVRTDEQILRSAGLDIPAEHDLALRAARMVQVETGCSLGADIGIRKQIPVGGGLGGGSSDAATVLVALNRLWDIRAPEARLRDWALRLGADVPVFVGGYAAFAEGVGERLTYLHGAQAPPEHLYLVIKPPCSVDTGETFQAPELTRNSAPITIRGFLELGGRNDCTATVCGRHPCVREALNWLSQFGEARLTGTGACVFAAMDSAARAAEVAAQLLPGYQGFVARGMNVSPLRALQNALDE